MHAFLLAALALPLLSTARRLSKRTYNAWNVTKCAWTPTTICNNQQYLYDPASASCYNAAQNPDFYNCAYLQQGYDETTTECAWSEAGYQTDCNDLCYIFDPNSGTCYDPLLVPNDLTCALFGKFYRADKNECCDVPADDDSGETNTCSNGELPVVDDSGAKTGECCNCGWCQAYGNSGTPACSTSGQCTLICPAGQSVCNDFGVLYCK